jgi:hypothetical protein
LQEDAEKVDVIGFLLETSCFILIIFALSGGPWHLASDPVTLIIGVLIIIAFWAGNVKPRINFCIHWVAAYYLCRGIYAKLH